MLEITSRTQNSVANKRNSFVTLASANYALVGLTDNVFKNREGEWLEAYRPVVARLDETNKIVDLIPVTWSHLKRRDNPILSKDDEMKNNFGSFIDFVDVQYATHSDLNVENLWHKHIIDGCPVLSVKAHGFYFVASDGKIRPTSVYEIERTATAFDVTAHKADIERLAQTKNIALYVHKFDSVVNPDAIDTAEKARAREAEAIAKKAQA